MEFTEHDTAPSLGTPLVTPVRPTSVAAPAEAIPEVTSDIVQSVYTYISQRGFYFSRELITRYLLSLHTKPFVIFSGISGTGKSKLALLVAEYYSRTQTGTQAQRIERPVDTEDGFFLRIEDVTLRSGLLEVSRSQADYFRIDPDLGSSITVNIQNVLGAQGDITFRVNEQVISGQRIVSLTVPVSVRRCFEHTGVTAGDYLRFEIVEEYKRFKVSLVRPEPEMIDIDPRNRYAFVSVRPSWNDHTSLLGYWNPKLEEYQSTPVLELLLRAGREERYAKEQGRDPVPYFIILDEMNLAKIEHYFADFLSALESRRRDVDGTIIQEPLHLHEANFEQIVWTDNAGVDYQIPCDLEIPTNVLFTGTVNDDETTHGLSPKVLDRANTMEFVTVNFDAFLGIGTDAEFESALELPDLGTSNLSLGVLNIGSQQASADMADDLRPLLAMNELLVTTGRHFGYRVLNEIAQYVANARLRVSRNVSPEKDAAVVHAAIDVQVLHKILPRFFHSASDPDGALAGLLHLCTVGEPAGGAIDVQQLLKSIQVDVNGMAMYSPDSLQTGTMPVDGKFVTAWYPRSAARLHTLLLKVYRRG